LHLKFIKVAPRPCAALTSFCYFYQFYITANGVLKMEFLKGKTAGQLAAGEILALTGKYGEIWLDIGTGDGQFVRQQARQNPARLVIGLDACRENLRESSRKAPPNALFVIANAFAGSGSRATGTAS
jgi:ubiquinone/menaquinone biosynthesis C-methylase UbiE